MSRLDLPIEPRAFLDVHDLAVRTRSQARSFQRRRHVGLHSAAVERAGQRGRTERLQRRIQIETCEGSQAGYIFAGEVELEIVELQRGAETTHGATEPARGPGNLF